VEERPNSVLYHFQNPEGHAAELGVVDALDWLVERTSQDAIGREQ
jgi:hypothetical protein